MKILKSKKTKQKPHGLVKVAEKLQDKGSGPLCAVLQKGQWDTGLTVD